jgi:hypothetical protein
MRLAERMRIERWDPGDTATAGPVPDEYLGQVAEVYNAFRDAPRGEGHGASVWDAGRIRARNEALGYEVVEPGFRHCELAVDGVR